ncbi:MAG: hypothetical protein GY764_00880 [Halieaceae bacterium]|nr:hypothetical protein [Halieaceae bacterium]
MQPDLDVTLVSQIGGAILAGDVRGDYAYVGVGPRLKILNIADPANPAVVGQTDVLAGILCYVTVEGDYAYVLAGYSGLRIIDIANPANPTEVSHFPTPDDIPSPTPTTTPTLSPLPTSTPTSSPERRFY